MLLYNHFSKSINYKPISDQLSLEITLNTKLVRLNLISIIILGKPKYNSIGMNIKTCLKYI